MISCILDKLFPSRVNKRVQRQNKFHEALELLEDIRFKQYMEEKKQREDRLHPNARMAIGVSKCQVGRFWTQNDYFQLVSNIKDGVTLETLSLATGRSYTGICNRLKILRMVQRSKHNSCDYWNSIVYNAACKFYTAQGKEINIRDLLISVGYEDKGKYLKCPDWLTNKILK